MHVARRTQYFYNKERMTAKVASRSNTAMSIAKGIAIILMVAGHAECPGPLMSFIYLFHMPLFFMAAGYFFSRKNVDNPWDFCARRFRGLYVPFLKWSLFFLIIHNFMFQIGVLNETYGNWSGGVTHPYTLHTMAQRAVSIVFSMGGYDEFLAGAFWFFRALLVSSIMFLVLYRLLDGKREWLSGWRVAAVICVAAIAFACFKISMGLKVYIIQGGIRETWGILFFGLGMIYRHAEQRLSLDWRQWGFWAAVAASAAILAVGTVNAWAGMNLAPKMRDVITLPLTGLAGFFLTYQLSKLIDRRNWWLKRFLVYCGNMTVYVYVFHIISFKVVSAIKIMWYGLDWQQMGCHMVIHDHHEDMFWILYTAAGVGLPLLWMWISGIISKKIKG